MVHVAAADPSPVVTTSALVAGSCVRCMGVAVRSEYTFRAELPPGSPGIPSEETEVRRDRDMSDASWILDNEAKHLSESESCSCSCTIVGSKLAT